MTGQIERVGQLGIDSGFGVTLRELTVDDAKAYFDLVDFDRGHFHDAGEGVVSENALTVRDVRDSLDPDNPFRKYDDQKGRFGIWATEVMVGNVNYTVRNLHEMTVEISYWVGRKHIGNKYAASAVRTLVPYLQKSGWKNIYARALPENIASRHTLRNAGLHEAATRLGGFVKYYVPMP